MDEKLELRIFKEVRSFLKYEIKPFTYKELCEHPRFLEIDECNKSFLIRQSLDTFESIGMVDKIGHIYYSNN